MPKASLRDYPFGLLMPGRIYQSSSETKEKFTGKERDSETGLDYFGARYYWAAGGRWWSVDAIEELSPDLSSYNYALNNPTNFYDSQGLSARGVIDSSGNIVVDENSFTPDNVPTLYVYDAEENLVAVYNLTDIENIRILQQLDYIARALGISGENVSHSLYLNLTPARDFALGASWFVVGGIAVGALSSVGISLSELNTGATWIRVSSQTGYAWINIQGLQVLARLSAISPQLVEWLYKTAYQAVTNTPGKFKLIREILHQKYLELKQRK